LANRGYLINSSTRTSDPAELERLREHPGHVDGDIAESANRLLIPWFLCFRKPDLRPVHCDFVQLQLPCTTVEQAVRNLEQSLPVFEAIARDLALARPYWELSCTLLRRLPLPYLTMDPIEVLQLGRAAPEVLAAHIVGALSGDFAAIPHLKFLSGYDDSAPPYPLEVLYSVPAGNKDRRRVWNASVLDGGFQPNFKYVIWRKAKDVAAPAAPPPPPESVFGELRGVRDVLKGWIQARVPSAPGADLGLWPGAVEQLQVAIYAGSDADARHLEGNADLRRQLDDLARTHLEPWCRKWGFGWKGFRFSSPE